jgi:arylsulfatase A-like enzyme
MVGTLAARELDGERGYVTPLRDLYDAEVAANDRSFGQLLAALEQRSLLADTLVVFVADHGEEFFEHGGWIHGRTLYEEVLHIPLLIRLPGQRTPRRVAAPVGEVDLLPTVLAVLGLPPLHGLDGRSLLGDLPEDRPIPAFLDVDEWRAVGVVRGGFAALRHCRLGGCSAPELYDLTADPGEEHDLGGRWPVRAATLVAEAQGGVLARRGRYHAGEAEISEELRRHLEALGYVSDGR